MKDYANPYVIELVDAVLQEFGYGWSIFRRPFGRNPSCTDADILARERVWAECRDRTARSGSVPSYPELAAACLGRRTSHSTVIEAVARYRKRSS